MKPIIAHIGNHPHIHPGGALALFITTLIFLGLCSWIANRKSK